MSATIFTLKIADPDVRRRIQEVIEREAADFSSEYLISVIDDQKNDQWKLRIERPDGTSVSMMLDGAVGEHEPESFSIRLRELLARP